ncbi:hypothetical protein [Candidatus Dactylopiibacterium carminicum]|nr:hypothetical protein [Candidatus Dactylopiibacterium carminicum]
MLRELRHTTSQRHACVELGLFLHALTPLPDPWQTGEWMGGLWRGGSFLMSLLAQCRLGWREELGYEAFRHEWFVAREKQQPEGTFTDEALHEAHQVWASEHPDKQAALAEFTRDFEQHREPVRAEFADVLRKLVLAAPRIPNENDALPKYAEKLAEVAG